MPVLKLRKLKKDPHKRTNILQKNPPPNSQTNFRNDLII